MATANAQEILLTPEGKKKLEEELVWREGEHLKEINDQIRIAKDFGDLSENAEYDAAKEEQAKNQARITEINNILANAKVAKKAKADVVSIGSSVTVLRKGTKKSVVYTLVGTTETNPLQNQISNESPVGAALMGKKVGESVEVKTPSGKKLELKIEKVEH